MHYHRLPDKPKKIQQISDSISEYLRNTKSFLDEDIEDLRKLSEVSHAILINRDGSLDAVLQNLFDMNIEGVEKIRVSFLPGYSRRQLLGLESHFRISAAFVAGTIYKRTEDVLWAKDWYHNALKAAIVLSEFEPNSSAEAFAIAGDAAFELVRKTAYRVQQQWRAWAVECYNNYLEYNRRLKKPDSEMVREVQLNVEHLQQLCSA